MMAFIVVLATHLVYQHKVLGFVDQCVFKMFMIFLFIEIKVSV